MLKVMAAPLALLLAAGGPSAALAHKWNSGDSAALIGGLLIGGIAASAVSSQHQHVQQYVPPAPPQPERAKAPFSPASGVICYPSQWACYNNGGQFNATWTHRIY